MVGAEEVCFVDYDYDYLAAFVAFGGEGVWAWGMSAALWNRGVPPRVLIIAA